MLPKQTLTVLLLLVAVASATTLQEDKKDYRLKKNFIPISYEISIDIPEEVLTTLNETVIPDAVVKITVKKPETNLTDKVFNFHMDRKFIAINQIIFKDNRNNSYNVTIIYDDDYNNTQIATINLHDEITENFTLTFKYNLTVSNTDMYGLYKSKYSYGGQEEYLLATQLATIYARRLFPCLDEPSFKATFKLNISTKAEGYQILTNAPELLLNSEEGIKESPNMSTYLVAIIVSRFDGTSGNISTDGTFHNIWSRKDLIDQCEFALEVGPNVLNKLNDLLKLNYNEMGIGKIDQVAIPDLAVDAMENWGLITYRENAILLHDNESSTADEMRALQIITHEFAHQWFGNLVTLDWWDVTFLNEGLATFMQYFATNESYPEYQMDKQFVVEILQTALEADSAPDAKALQSNCTTESEILAKFDDISYNKGASIINMVRHYISEEEFLKGLNKYLTSHKFKNVRPEDLWEALNTDKINMTNIMHDWINEPGFPLIHVSYKDKKVTVTQFTLANDKKASSWQVPIKYKYSVSGTEPVESIELLENNTKDIALDNLTWVHLENAKGFYRVNYDEDLWKHLTDAITENNTKIDDIDQSQIVDDLFTLGRINELPYSTVFNHIKFLEKSDNYFVWVSALRGFDFLLKRFGDDTELGKKISGTILEMMNSVKKILESTPVDSVEKLKRELIYNWLCRLKDEKIVNEAETKFANYIKDTNSESIDPDLRSAVYCYGQKDDSDWDKLFENYKKTKVPSEKEVILKSLACAKNSNKIQQLLTKTLENKEIRAQDGHIVFLAVLNHDVESALNFFKKSHEDIANMFSGFSLKSVVTALADRLTKEEQIKKLESVLIENNLNEKLKAVLDSSVKKADANLKWSKKNEKELKDFYGLGGSANAIQFSVSCMFSLSFAILYTYYLF